MVFVPPAWAPALPEPPDSVSVPDFLYGEAHGRRPLATSRDPYTCGLTGATRSAALVARRVDRLTRALARRLGSGGTPWARVVAVFSLNTVRDAARPAAAAADGSPRIDYVPFTHAVLRADGIVSPASAAASASELEHQLRTAGAAAIVTCLPLLGTARAAAAAAGIRDDRVFLLPVPGSGPAPPGLAAVDDLVAEGEALPPLPPLRWADGQGARQTAYLCLSSGTSGLPKAVMLSHRNIIASVLQQSLAESVGRRQLGVDTQAALGVLPFGHIYGLVIVGLVGQFRGDQTVVLPRFDLATTLAAVERHGIAQLSVVPPILMALLADADAHARFDLGSVRFVSSGAAPLSPELLDGLRQRYPRWHLGQGYGLTEASPGVTATSEADCLLGSSGSLIPGTRAKLVDAAGREVTALETPGELLVQSPSVALGYLGDERANAETFVWHADGRWLRTGDEVLVRRSPQGHEHLVVVDRIKELIKVKGLQVAPAELEAHLLTHPLVADCAVIPVPDARAGQVPKAFVVKAPGAAGRPDADVAADIARHVERHKARHKWLRGGLEFVDAIPKSPSGKILRRLLRDKEAQARKTPAARL